MVEQMRVATITEGKCNHSLEINDKNIITKKIT